MIDVWYRLVDLLLPFEWTGHMFMKNALLAVLLVTPIFGLLGTMIVNNRMAFFSDAIGHSALTGIAIGVLLGFMNPLGSMIVFALIFAVIISLVKSASKSSPDTIIGVFSAMAIALGLVILSRGGGFNKYSGYLIGDLLNIAPSDILMLIILFACVLVFWSTAFNKLLLVSVNPSLAGSRGINTKIVEIIFTAIMSVIVIVSIQWVGLLIINSLLILPAAAARNLTRNMRQYHLYSVCISVISGLTGLILSYYLDTATGATIVLISALFYFASLVKLKLN